MAPIGCGDHIHHVPVCKAMLQTPSLHALVKVVEVARRNTDPTAGTWPYVPRELSVTTSALVSAATRHSVAVPLTTDTHAAESSCSTRSADVARAALPVASMLAAVAMDPVRAVSATLSA